MKFGFRRPSLRKRIAARTSWKRVVRHNLGVKAPRGYGWLTNSKKAAYNRVYNRTTVGLGKGCLVVLMGAAAAFGAAILLLLVLIVHALMPHRHEHRSVTRQVTHPTPSGPRR